MLFWARITKVMQMLKCKNHTLPTKRSGKYKVQVKDNCFMHFKLLISLILNPVITPAIFMPYLFQGMTLCQVLVYLHVLHQCNGPFKV